MTDEPKLEFTTDAFGHVACGITHEGVLLTKGQAESVVERIKALEELCGDLFARLMDEDEICGECRSQCDYDAWNFGADGCIYRRRMDNLGIPHD